MQFVSDHFIGLGSTYVQSFHIFKVFVFPIGREITEDLGVIDFGTMLQRQEGMG